MYRWEGLAYCRKNGKRSEDKGNNEEIVKILKIDNERNSKLRREIERI